MTSTIPFPLLDKLIKLCKREKKRQNEDKGNLSYTWILFSQGSAFLLAVGFFMVCSENVFDKSIQCYIGNNKEHFVSYVLNYCYMHGTFHIKREMQGKVTPCIVYDKKYEETAMTKYEETAVTKYYIWLPYLFAFLFVLARFPYWIWRRFYAVKILKLFSVEDPHQLIFQFLYYNFIFNRISRTYFLLEMLNILFLLFSFTFTHFVLNREFFFYGFEVTKYFFSEEIISNPACNIFPTEVNCRFTMGASTGTRNESNFLCILSNNVFNQIFFFVLWYYWILILLISILGFCFRFLRYNFSSLSKFVCLHKIENPLQGEKLKQIQMTANEWFFFECLLDIKDSVKQDELIEELCLQIKSYAS